MADRNAVFRYILTEYFNGNIEKMAQQTDFSQNDLIAWRDEKKIPQRKNVEYLLNIILTPEFKVITEFFEVNQDQVIFSQLRYLQNSPRKQHSPMGIEKEGDVGGHYWHDMVIESLSYHPHHECYRKPNFYATLECSAV